MYVPYYVIEIHIFPFKPEPHIDPIILQLHPIYEDEEERVYLRGAASIRQVNVIQLTVRGNKVGRTNNYYYNNNDFFLKHLGHAARMSLSFHDQFHAFKTSRA